LDEAGTEVDIELHQRGIANGLEAVDLASLDHKDVSGAALERFAVHGPQAAAFADELDFVVRVPMRTRSRTRLTVEQKNRNTGWALVGSDKLMRTADERKILVAHVMHGLVLLAGLDENGHGPVSRAGRR